MVPFWSFSEYSNRPGMDFLFPYITLGMFCDVLSHKGYRFVSLPQESAWVFRWYDMYDDGSTCPYDIDSYKILHIRNHKMAAELLRNNDTDFVLVISDRETLYEDFEPYTDRVIQALSPTDKMATRSDLQQIFMDMLIWENRLNYASVNVSSMEELLDIGTTLLNHFLFIASVNGDLVANSEAVGPPTEECREFVESRTIPKRIRDLIFEPRSGSLTDSHLRTFALDDGHTCVCAPLVFKNDLFAYVIMVCENKTYGKGINEAFSHFSKYARILCYKHWARGVELDVPHFFFLNSLLEGQKYSHEVLDTKLQELDIPQDAIFKLVAIDARDCLKYGFDTLADALSRLHEGHSLVIPYGDLLLALCYSNETGFMLSHRRTTVDFDKYIFKPFGVTGAMSQVFESISDLNLAVRQALFVFKYYRIVEIEMQTIGGQELVPIFFFEMVFSYLLINHADVDEEFLDFSFSHAVPERIAREDLLNNTHNFALLWYFLSYERNASFVAKRLFMHRNTVLYHIKQIEKHFDFELSNQFFREKLTLEFRMYFARMNVGTLKKLFTAAIPPAEIKN